MGNKLAYDKPDACEGPGDDVIFFQNLNIKWMTLVVSRLREVKDTDFNLRNKDEKIKWNNYFKIFSDIKDKMIIDTQIQKKNVWHTATLGYSMGPQEVVDEESDEEEIDPNTPKLPDDDYTDDDPSELSESDEDSEEDEEMKNGSDIERSDKSNGDGGKRKQSERPRSAVISKKVQAKWNSAHISPIFFGYNTVKQITIDTQKAEEKATLKLRENRAIGKAKEARSAVIDASERTMRLQEANRLKKIGELDEKYKAAREKTERDCAKNKMEMHPTAFDIYKVCWMRY
jgi:hypothetical protein